MRVARQAIDDARRRLAAARDRLALRCVALDHALKRGIWSSRLTGFAFAGTGVLMLLPLLDGRPAGVSPPHVQPAGKPGKQPSRSPLAQTTAHAPAPSNAPTVPASPPPGDIAREPPRAEPPSAMAPTWRIVPTRRMDLTGLIVDSADPATTAREAAGKAVSGPNVVVAATKPATGADKAGNAEQSNSSKPSTDQPLPVPPSSAPVEPQADAWTDAEIAEARAECARLVTGVTIDGEEAEPVRNGACGTPAPITVKRAGGSMIELSPPALVNCRFAVALNGWINDTLQPAAQASFGAPVVRIITASSYVCRNRYGQSKAPISEHAFANALDISGFVLRDGRVVKVLGGWGATARDIKAANEAKEAQVAAIKAAEAKAAATKTTDQSGGASNGPASSSAVQGKADDAKRAEPPAPGEPKGADAKAKDAKIKKKHGTAQAATLDAASTGAPPLVATAKSAGAETTFLRKVHGGACGQFGTVLGPEANDAHRDHIHVDLKQRKHASICE